MKPEIIIKITKELYDRVYYDLKRPHSFAFERVGFISTKQKILKSGTIIIFGIDYFPIADEFYIDDPSVGARINSNAIRKGLQIILDKKVGLFHTHLHDFSFRNSIPEFSQTDMTDCPEIVKSFENANRNKIHGMIVLGKDGNNALVKLQGVDKLISPSRITIVGYPMLFSFPTLRSRKKTSLRYDRQSFLGSNSEFIINNTRIGIVGLGGGGSHIVQQLAYLGFKNYVLYDYDTVEETNLNRMIGAGCDDVKNEAKKVEIAERLIRHLHNDAIITKIEKNWVSQPEFLQECDIIVGCVDSFSGRRDLELECRRYLIPYIDIGMDINQQCITEPPSIGGQIIISMPGKLCMSCLGFLNENNLAKEAAKYGDAGGKPQVVWSNGLLASQAVGIIVDLITGWSGISELNLYYSYDGNAGLLTKHIRLKYAPKQCKHFDKNDIGEPEYIPI